MENLFNSTRIDKEYIPSRINATDVDCGLVSQAVLQRMENLLMIVDTTANATLIYRNINGKKNKNL